MAGKNHIFLIFILSFLVVCSSEDKVEIPDEIKLSYIPFSADLPFFVALDNGYFKRNGLNVIPVECKNSSEALDLVLSGRTVGSMGNSFSVLFSIHSINDNKIRLINVSSEFEEDNRFTTFILTANETQINSIDDFKNKIIGAGKGISQLVWVNLYFRKHGIDPENDLTIIQESSENLLNGLMTNQFNAIFIFEPYGTIALSNSFGNVYQTFFRKFVMNPFPAGGAVLSKDFIDKYPKAAKLIVKSLDEAIEYININPQSAKNSLVSYTPTDSTISLKSNIYYWWASSDIKKDQIQSLADIMNENKVIENKIVVDGFIYNSNDR